VVIKTLLVLDHFEQEGPTPYLYGLSSIYGPNLERRILNKILYEVDSSDSFINSSVNWNNN
jgi:hypothetical protein